MVCVGGIRMSTITASGGSARTAASSASASPTSAVTSNPRVGEQAREAAPEQRRVVRDDHPHGSVAVTRVPPPAGARHREPAAHGRDTVGEPAQPGAVGVRAADAVVDDLDPQPCPSATTSTVTCVADACFAALVRASETTK